MANQVTADALPTVQIDGVVWSEVIVGNTVYAGGSFANARPAGAAPGTNQVTRKNLLSFNLTTGNLNTSFAPSLNAQAKVVVASPDGSRIYVGGSFTQADGVNRYRIAAYDTATGQLISSWAPSVDATVDAIAVTNNAVYVGGAFGTANGVARAHLAAFSPTTGALLGWAPTADDDVHAMVVTPDGSRVIVGGQFLNVNGSSAIGLAAVDATTGALLPWAATSLIQEGGSASTIADLSTDGNAVYGVGWAYGSNISTLEGAFSASPDSGTLNWIENCWGDVYGITAMNNAVYTVGHNHACEAMGAFPDHNPRQFHRSMAFTADAEGSLGHDIGNPDSHSTDFYSQPAPGIINWWPDLDIGTYTGQSQGPWSVTTNSQYVVEGGEFLHVNGTAQQGLVRFAVPSLAPNKQGPRLSGASLNTALLARSSTSVRVSWGTDWDRDDKTLTFTVQRNGTTVYTTTADGLFWNLPSMGFIDTGLSPGTTYNYKVTVSDPSGNVATGNTVSITTPTSSGPADGPYVQDVLNDGASNYWRLGETSGSTGFDYAGFNDLAEGSGVGHGAAGAIIGDSNGASTFDGTGNGNAATTSAIAGPNTFTIETWIKTTTTSGGKIVGFGDAGLGGTSSNYDRHIYMDNAGHIIYGVYNNGVYTVGSSGSYNDGQWHQIVATLSGSGMTLYIDGKKVGTNTGTTVGQSFGGYWRLGGDNLNGWPAQPSSNNFAGTIDDAAIYPTALTLSQVQKHYVDSGRTLNIPTPPTDSYGKAIYADSPDLYWRLDEASGRTAQDTSPNGSNGVYFGTIGYRTASPVTGANGTGVTLDGSTSQISSASSFNNPTVYSEELWFITTTTQGGKLIGFGDQQSGLSGSYDRHVWMLNSGQLEFGTWTGQPNTITSPNSYNDGKWHQVVATQGPDGMTLYVDGVAVGTNPQPNAQPYTGYWKVGGDVTWGGNSSNYFAGVVDEVSVYSHELTAARVLAQYTASPAAVNKPPVASFTQSCTGLTCTFDASASNDPDGAITNYSWDFGDGTTRSGVTATHTYPGTGTRTVALTVTDNGGATDNTTSTISPQPTPADAYGQAVAADKPTLYWRLDEAGGPTAHDASFNGNPGTYTGGASFQTPSTVTGPNGTGVTLNGSDGLIASQNTFDNPTVFSEELWFTTTTTQGGKLIGFGDQQSGLSGSYDRHVWMLNSGQLEFGTYTSQANTIISPGSYNDGKWHQVVAGIGPGGMVLYVDGQLVGSNPNTGSQAYTGYWRVGGDSTWGGNSSNYFAGEIDEVAVFPTVLSAADVQNQYHLGTSTDVAPTAAFTPNCTNLQCSFDGSGSNDPDGSIAGYSWDFGDNTAVGSGVSPNHTYAQPGTYAVKLTVTDNKGATNTVTHNVTVTNQPPNAAVTFNCPTLSCTFDGSGSNDPDGSIAAYSWDFGDNTAAGSGVSPNHSYVQAGTYTVKLTVTDNAGGTDTVSHDVTVSPPANQPPNAVFTSNCTNLGCSFDGSQTSDPDGTVVSYAWTFGDGNTGTGANASDSYPVAGDYTVTLTVTDNQGATNSASHTVSPRPSANPPSTPYATDAFNRTVTGGWGNAVTGGAWTVSSAAKFSVAGGVGSIIMSAPATQPTVYLKSLSTTDTDTTATIATDKAGTGGGIYLGLLGRRVSSGVDYQAQVKITSTNTLVASLLSDNAGTQTVLKPNTTVPGVTYSPGLQLKFRLQVTGTNPTTLRFKVWPGTSTEPTAWFLTTTDNTPALQLAGSVGLSAYLSGTATNAPVTERVSMFATAPTVAPPTATFPTNCAGQACSVDAGGSTDPSGTISAYQWSWGDGTVATGSTSSHTYAGPGTYRITLTVTDPSGWTDVTTRTVTLPA